MKKRYWEKSWYRFLAAAILAVSMGVTGFADTATNLPPLLAPVTLRDDEGRAEQDLVDPFRRRGADDVSCDDAVPGENGLLRTSLGEISSEFKILAITIPADTNTLRSALIQFYSSDEPILVHEGDLVRVDRMGVNAARGGVRGNIRGRRPNAARVAASRGRHAPTRQGGLADIDLEEQLRKYVFYVNVKNIESTYIEVYHNKKRPDETIRLNW